MTEVRPDDPGLADDARRKRGAYVHIPFCARICPYCDFAVVAGKEDLSDRYVDAVVAEIAMESPWAPLDALHIGGGTPSRLPVESLRRILDALRSRFGLAADAEVGLEANPEDWTPEYAAGVLAAGFNRVSLGVQSFDPAVLGDLGRLHNPGNAVDAVSAATSAGFDTVNIDLIFGSPAETMGSWETSLETAIGLGPHHLSTYALTVERGTPLGREVAAGGAAPDPDEQAAKWEVARSVAASAGFIRYETSNYAVPGKASVYNLLTWAQGEYVAFGTGAHGHRDGERTRNVQRLDAYLDRVEAGARPVAGTERADRWGRELERLLLGLRRAAGVEIGEGGDRLLKSEWGERLVDAGVVAVVEGRLLAQDPLLGDEIARAVLALSPGDC